ncbi:MAG TPA: site-2 protease family protein [Kofleriaceae bacterium]|jgi:Zn-dependent protease|nr:site-2 protease family protein [Kofleriaceae bacterium]
MDLSPDQIRWILIYVFVLLISVALHEFGHAIMADRLGDDTPRRQGRVTLNPLAHADPIGTLLLPVVGSLYGAMTGVGGGFGWGKPVQWQPHRVSRRVSMSMAKILVAFAGPAMNIVLAVVVALVHTILMSQHVVAYSSGVGAILRFAVIANFTLFFFNLLPMPPLDGGHIAQSFTPYRYRDRFDQIMRFAPFIVLALMLTPQMRFVFSWPANHLASYLYEGYGHLFGVV